MSHLVAKDASGKTAKSLDVGVVDDESKNAICFKCHKALGRISWDNKYTSYVDGTLRLYHDQRAPDNGSVLCYVCKPCIYGVKQQCTCTAHKEFYAHLAVARPDVDLKKEGMMKSTCVFCLTPTAPNDDTAVVCAAWEIGPYTLGHVPGYGITDNVMCTRCQATDIGRRMMQGHYRSQSQPRPVRYHNISRD